MTAELPLISFKKYVRDLDDALILGLKAFTEEKQRKVYQAMLNASDEIYFYDALRRQDVILFRLDGFSINFNTGEIAFKTKVAPIYYENVDELIPLLKKNVKSTLYVIARLSEVRKTRRGKTKIYTDEIKIVVGDYDEDMAKQLLSEYEPLDLICYAIGYEPTPEVKALLLPRLIPQFKPFGLPVNVMQFTPPETGKTHTAKMLTVITNSYHALNFPSRAKLIGDARFNSYGLCYKYDVIYVEEFEKMSGKKLDEFKEDYEALLTGLEQGKWQREKSSRTDIDYFNPVSFCLFGNVKDKSVDDYALDKLGDNARDKIKALIEELTGLNVAPFVQRFVYVEYLTEAPTIMRYILRNENNEPTYLHPAVSRAIFDILTHKCVSSASKPKAEVSRLDRHFNTLYSILKTLNVEIDDDTIERLVKGNTTFLQVLQDTKDAKETTEQKYEELDEMTLKEMLDSVGW